MRGVELLWLSDCVWERRTCESCSPQNKRWIVCSAHCFVSPLLLEAPIFSSLVRLNLVSGTWGERSKNFFYSFFFLRRSLVATKCIKNNGFVFDVKRKTGDYSQLKVLTCVHAHIHLQRVFQNPACECEGGWKLLWGYSECTARRKSSSSANFPLHIPPPLLHLSFHFAATPSLLSLSLPASAVASPCTISPKQPASSSSGASPLLSLSAF